MYDQELNFTKGTAVQLTVAALTGGALRPDDTEAFLERMFAAVTSLGAKPDVPPAEAVHEAPVVTAKEARKSIGRDKITCLICGAKMRVLTKHLEDAHGISAKEYKARFGLPKDQALCCRDLTEQKRNQAATLGLAKHLADAREKKAGLAKSKKASKGATSKGKKAASAPAPAAPSLGLE